MITLRRWLAARVWRLANWLEPKTYPDVDGARLVEFRKGTTYTLGRPTFNVISRRGGFLLGRVEFRNQWNEWCFYPSYDGMFNKQMVAEIYAKLKGVV